MPLLAANWQFAASEIHLNSFFGGELDPESTVKPLLFCIGLDIQGASSKRPLLHHYEEHWDQNQNMNC